MKPTTFLSLALLLGLALGVPGCAAPPPTLLTQGEQVWVNRDLPVPEGFVLDEGLTWRHERSSFRRLRLVYRRPDYLGRARVAEFVRDQFPGQGWTVKFVYGDAQPKVLLHKGGEECRATARENDDGETELVLEVEPRQTPSGELVANAPREAAPTLEAPPVLPPLRREISDDADIAPTTSDQGSK